MSVIWTLECDAIGFSQYFEAESHVQAVTELVKRGFKRMWKDDVPYFDEAVIFEDKHGRVWDAMPAVSFDHITRFPDKKTIAKLMNGRKKASAGK